jgi:hypothetical protein
VSNKEDLQLLIQPYMDAIDKLSQILRVRDAQLSQAQASLAVAVEALKGIVEYERGCETEPSAVAMANTASNALRKIEKGGQG